MILGHSTITTLLYIAVLGMTVYSGVLVLYVIFMLWTADRESRLRRRQSDVDDYDVVRGSRYTIPVSIIAPTFNEEIMAVPAVRSLLALSYPELEVIVVDDGSTDGTLAALDREFDLEARQVFFRNSLASKPVRTVYKSRKEPRLTVVSKENGGKADALNCGINFARYRYLCCVDGDTVFARDALLKAMSLVAKDPARIVAVASLFGISLEPEALSDSKQRPRTTGHLLGDFQHLDLMRSFVAYRLAWSRLECMLCVSGAFGIWRRDVILEMGGFSPAFTCEDIEMTFRIHEKFLREERPYRIVSLPHMVAQTEGPNNIRSLVSQRARWQRVTLETIWHYKRMMGRSCYRTAGLIGMPYYVLFECLAPVFQLLSLVTLVVAIAMGLLNWPAYLAFLGITIFGTAIPTTVAVTLHDAGFRDYRMRDLVRMLALGPLDLLFYRPILIYAGLRGCWEFLRKEKGWNKFDRNVRRPTAAVTVATSLLLLTLLAPFARGQASDTVAQASHLAQAGRPRQAAELLEQRLSSNPDDVDALVALATALRQLNRKAEALAVIGRAAARAPTRDDVARLRRQLTQEVHGTDILVTDNYEKWNDDRGPWGEAQLAVRQNTDVGPAIVRVSRATRAGLHDDRIEAEAYPRIGTGYLALGAGYATNAVLYARSTITAELFESLVGGFEASVGYRRLNFLDAVNIMTASAGMYAGDYLLGARVNHLAGGASGTSVALSGRRYMSDGVQYVGLQASGGSARDDIQTQADIATLASRGLVADALFLVHERWLIVPRVELGLDDTHTARRVGRTAVSLGLGVRF